jgi:hypothetical protein
MNEKLNLWQTERERIAAQVRHGSIDAQEGVELLAMIDQRVAEHAHGTVPVETEAQDAEAAPVLTTLPANVVPLRSAASQRDANARRAEQSEAQGMAVYRRAFVRIGRKPPAGDAATALVRTSATQGRGLGAIGAFAPSGLFNWYAERREAALRVCADIRARLGGGRNE